MSSARVTAAGSITAAIASAATWFCCLPFAIGFLSAGTSTFALALGRFRPVFNGAALLLIGIALVQSYRSTKECTDEAVCRKARFGRVFLWATAVFVVAMIAAPLWTSWVIYFFIT